VFYKVMIEIDGVRHELEYPGTEACDYIADDYLECIDIATSPDRTSHKNKERLASLIRRLNRNLSTTSSVLVGTSVEPAYNSVVVQINAITQSDSVGELKPLISDESRFEGYSGSYTWAN
jgi:hypothetical protein